MYSDIEKLLLSCSKAVATLSYTTVVVTTLLQLVSCDVIAQIKGQDSKLVLVMLYICCKSVMQ